MRGAGITAFHGDVELLDLPEPTGPAADEVLLEVRAAGVASWDDLIRTGSWEVGRKPPMALGTEAAGVVVAVGSDVDGFAVGDRVLTHSAPLRFQGAWAERFLAPAAHVAAIPAGVSDDLAAVLPIPAMTAHMTLRDDLDLTPGLTLLVNGAGGVTGRIFVELAVQFGAIVYATAGPGSHEAVRAAGAAEVVDYHDPDWPARIRSLLGGAGVDFAVNAAAGGEDATLATVRDGGRMATITGAPPAPERSVEISSVSIAPDGQRLARLAKLAAAGAIDIPIGATFGLADAGDALAQARHSGGHAIVLRP